MDTMTLTIEVSKNIGAILEEKAKEDGKNISEYVESLIEQDINTRRWLDKILAPVRERFAKDGMSEEELYELIENERQAIWKEKNGQS